MSVRHDEPALLEDLQSKLLQGGRYISYRYHNIVEA